MDSGTCLKDLFYFISLQQHYQTVKVFSSSYFAYIKPPIPNKNWSCSLITMSIFCAINQSTEKWRRTKS